MLALRKAPGVDRPAIAVLWPSSNPAGYNVLLDAGADIRADADDLLKYAVMGASYARNALGLTRPRVGLLNVGTEEHKGRSRAARGGRADRRGRPGQRLRVHRLRRGQRHAVRPRRRDRHRRLHRQRRAEDRRGHRADDPGPAAGGLRLQRAQPHRRALRADLAEAAAEAHRPAPGQRRGVPRAERHGDQVATAAPTPPGSRRRSSSPSPSPSTASPRGSRRGSAPRSTPADAALGRLPS